MRVAWEDGHGGVWLRRRDVVLALIVVLDRTVKCSISAGYKQQL